MNRLNFNHLFYFYTIAKEGSIKGACQKLHLTQPTMSDQLKELEDYFGCKLFDRRSRRLFLTQPGEIAFDYSKRMFSSGDELRDRIASGDLEGAETVKVGIDPSLSRSYAYRLIVPALEGKKIKVKVSEASFKKLLIELQEGDVDILLTDQISTKFGTGLKSVDVGTSRYFAVVGPKFKSQTAGFPRCLESIPFFNYSTDSKIRQEIDYFFLSNKLNIKTIGEASDVGFLRLMALKNQCFAILPSNVVGSYLPKERLISLGEIQSLKTKVTVLFRANTESVAVRKLVGEMKKKKKTIDGRIG